MCNVWNERFDEANNYLITVVFKDSSQIMNGGAVINGVTALDEEEDQELEEESFDNGAQALTNEEDLGCLLHSFVLFHILSPMSKWDEIWCAYTYFSKVNSIQC